MSSRRARAAVALTAAALALPLAAAPATAAIGDTTTVVGTVTDVDGAPMAGVTVNIAHGMSFDAVVTDDLGAYEFSYVQQADWEIPFVSVWESGVQCGNYTGTGGTETVTINCFVPHLITVSFAGHVTMTDGSDPAGQWINGNDDTYMYGNGTEIGVDGTFALDMQVPATAMYIELYGPGQPSYQYEGFEDGTVYSDLELVFEPWGDGGGGGEDAEMTVTGTVTDRKGRPLAEVPVSLFNGYSGADVVTAEDGTYTVSGFWPYDPELGGMPVWLSVDGVLVDWIDNLTPDAPLVVDYRAGKSPVFEPFETGLDLGVEGEPSDLLRKIDDEGDAEWAVCSAGGYCYGFAFGTKKTEFFDTTPLDDYTGVREGILRTKHDGTYDWYRFEGYEGNPERATFGSPRADGTEYFRFQPESGLDLVTWVDKGGETTVWSWGKADGLEGVQSITVDGRFVSLDHLDLDANGADDVVLVTRHGRWHTVYLLTSSTAEPIEVATGKGVAQVTYEDLDADGVLDVVVSFA